MRSLTLGELHVHALPMYYIRCIIRPLNDSLKERSHQLAYFWFNKPFDDSLVSKATLTCR
ncbi:hypothetical protein T10_2793 [Trichinella papuae]|uniref:Uncharacterized protein n=1 Tax=Trichinella papuae TaxID=268474 RepID=A0A0V1MPE4_9BILA|nr:hypothetical protein T10_2793 [Trichinella papuae]